jgi:hypothetical protein
MLKRLAVAALPIAAAIVVVLPLALDQPFAAQTPRLMAAIYSLRRVAPALTAVAAVAMLIVAILRWRHVRRAGRAALLAAFAVTIGAAWFARQNVFEWVFSPLPRPAFVPAQAATFVEPNDLVVAVRIGDETVAYPIRQMAYHHLVNDRIGRTPAVVTY